MSKSKIKKPLISIIICTNNSEISIRKNLDSISTQKYKNYELVVIDNLSKDKTIDIIKKYNFPNIKLIIEKDNGIYNAINKGINIAKGEIISILHSDDYYYDNNTLKIVSEAFLDTKIDLIYGNLVYVFKNSKKKLRIWKSSKYFLNAFCKGWSPPHPTFICRKKTYVKGKLYKENIGNSADIELMYRFLEILNFRYKFINKTLVVMSYGGKSNQSLKNIFLQNLCILKFLKINKNLKKIIIFFYYKFRDRLNQFLKVYK